MFFLEKHRKKLYQKKTISLVSLWIQELLDTLHLLTTNEDRKYVCYILLYIYTYYSLLLATGIAGLFWVPVRIFCGVGSGWQPVICRMLKGTLWGSVSLIQKSGASRVTFCNGSSGRFMFGMFIDAFANAQQHLLDRFCASDRGLTEMMVIIGKAIIAWTHETCFHQVLDLLWLIRQICSVLLALTWISSMHV